MSSTSCEHRPTWVEVDLSAVRDNVARLRALAAPASLMAVVKADAYGHGLVPVARAALQGGAAWLAVALVERAWRCAPPGSTLRSCCSASRPRPLPARCWPPA